MAAWMGGEFGGELLLLLFLDGRGVRGRVAVVAVVAVVPGWEGSLGESCCCCCLVAKSCLTLLQPHGL